MAKKPPTERGVVDAALRAGNDLLSLEVSFALVGGLAVGARGQPRFTRDVDLAVSTRADGDAEAVVRGMSGQGYRVMTVIEHQRRKRLATARLVHRGDATVFIDLLFASSGIEPEIAAHADSLHLRPRVALPVAQLGHLLAMKVLSESDLRLQDRIDLGVLSESASEVDWRLAEEALRLIRRRGFHRGRPLLKNLRTWRERQ